MLRTLSHGGRLCDGISRREMLRIGGVGTLSLWGGHMLDLPRAAAAGGTFGKARSVIFFSLYGGPAHQDAFDLKPHAPDAIRGEFQPIDTTVSGIRISEYLPRLAKAAHLYTLVRSVSHHDNGHESALYTALTGWPHPQPNTNAVPKPEDYPHYATMMSLVKPPTAPVPPFVMTGGIQATGVGQNGGFLGSSWDPYVIAQDADAPDFRVPELAPAKGVPAVRLDRRRRLLDQVDDLARQLDRGSRDRTFTTLQERAFELLISSKVPAAFNIDAEPAAVRDRYGRFSVGQNLLLARRLVEAGVPAIQVSWNRGGAWDTHGNNFNSLKGSLLPPFDQCLSALLEDLDRRGLLEHTLVLAIGEFGRTPTINRDAGRDHWAGCYTALLAGAGIRPGRVYGASDAHAAYPLSDAVGPWDLGATVLHSAGIDPHTMIRDRQDRPIRICRGEPIHALF